MKKPHTLTRTAASLLLIPLIHLAFLAVSGWVAYLLEFSTNRGAFYVFFAVHAMLLFFMLPFVILLTAHASIGCGICAMCRGGSRIKNMATVIVSAVLIISVILLLAEFIPRLLEGMASV